MITKSTRTAGAALFIFAASALTPSCTTDRTRRGYLERLRPTLTSPRRPVIVIPGFGVSRLFDPVTGQFVWGTPKTMVRTAYEDDLDLPFDQIAEDTDSDRLVPRGFLGSRGPVNIGWQLTEALRKYGGYRPAPARQPYDPSEVDLYPFDYDWRLGASANASKLDALIERIRRDHHDPALKVDLVGHSAGGLIILTYLRLGTASPEVPAGWASAAREASSKVDRAVLISPPLLGTIDAFRILNEEERFVRRRFSIDIVATWPSVAELLPADGLFLIGPDGRTIQADMTTAGAWQQLRLGPHNPSIVAEGPKRLGSARAALLQDHFAASLRRAAVWRQALREAPPSEVPIALVAGDCVPTLRKVLRRPDGSLVLHSRQLRPGERALETLLFEPGDGSVTVTSAQGFGKADTLLCDGHQGIATDPNLHRALIRFLQ